MHVERSGEYWRLNIDYTRIRIDFKDYIDIINDKENLSQEKIERLISIVERGNFLNSIEYHWLDNIKFEITNDIIDSILQYTRSVPVAGNPELFIKLANQILYFDNVNEDALSVKCSALVYLGKHSLAKSAFDIFCREYEAIYDQPFDRTFHETVT